MKAALRLIGIVLTAAGLLFALQGAGIVAWPRESFMIGAGRWIEYGVIIIVAGLALIFAAGRIRRKS
jgi:hypothetical protein